MQFTPLRLAGAFLLDLAAIDDERGFFALTWAPDAFTQRGLDPGIVQCNLSWNRRKGTLRGMHFQIEPFSEVKLIRCTRGALFDVIVDLRSDSPTFRQWLSVELTADNRRALYVPRGFAHGYLTLTDDVEAYYHVSTPFSPEHAQGVRWNDPAFGIEWPFEPTIVSAKDRAWPDVRLKPDATSG
jgi:dTDP-4-dehydrorhamnose 3,5-epimerase